jgi:hypothetical protein
VRLLVVLKDLLINGRDQVCCETQQQTDFPGNRVDGGFDEADVWTDSEDEDHDEEEGDDEDEE